MSLADEFEQIMWGLHLNDSRFEAQRVSDWVNSNRDRILAALRRDEEDLVGDVPTREIGEALRIAAIVRNPTDEQAQEIGSSPFYDEANRLRPEPDFETYNHEREGRDACKAILYLATGNEK